MWITSMGNHGAVGGISERRRSSCSSLKKHGNICALSIISQTWDDADSSLWELLTCSFRIERSNKQLIAGDIFKRTLNKNPEIIKILIHILLCKVVDSEVIIDFVKVLRKQNLLYFPMELLENSALPL